MRVQGLRELVIPDGYVLMPKELTAENGAKAALIGEFYEEREVRNPSYCGCYDCDFCHNFPDVQEYEFEKTAISWTSLKAIHRAAVAAVGKETL